MLRTLLCALLLVLGVGCGPSEGPRAEPPADEPPVDEAAAATPAPSSVAVAPCVAAVGRVFRTLEALECGRGRAQCRWRLSVAPDAVRWRWSDTAATVKYTCSGSVLTPTPRYAGDDLFPERVIVGPGGSSLDWAGRIYYADGMEPEPPPTADEDPAEEVEDPKHATPDATPATEAHEESPSEATPKPKGLLGLPTEPTTGLDSLMGVPIAKLGTDEEARRCSSSSDCRVSTRVDGDCCPHGCGPASAYNAGYLERLEAHHKEACKGTFFRCPAVACARVSYRAECVEGRCEARREGW